MGAHDSNDAGNERGLRSAARSFGVSVVVLFLIGFIVHFCVMPLIPESVRQDVDHLAWDAMMRDRATGLIRKRAEESQTSAASPPRFVFINVDDATCLKWLGTPCTLSSSTPRGKLADITDAIGKASASTDKPALVVIDIDLAPVAAPPDPRDNFDPRLCGSVARLSKLTPVIVVRPTVIDVANKRIEGHPSIFDAAFDSHEPPGCAGGQAGDLWFGSPVVWADADGVVRRVGTRDAFWINEPRSGEVGETGLGAIGLLGATLLHYHESATRTSDLTCLFPGSKRLGRASCMFVGTGDDKIKKILANDGRRSGTSLSPAEILFSIPAEKLSGYSVQSDIFCSVSASSIRFPPAEPPTIFLPAPCSRTNALAGAVVVIGGSYLASGDLRRTPIDVKPVAAGAMIHINAMRAFAMALRSDDTASWTVDMSGGGLIVWGLILLSAFLGALFHALEGKVVRGTTAMRGAVLSVILSGIWLLLQVAVILAVVLIHGAAQFIAGFAVEIFTPVLAVMLEGLSQTLHAIHELMSELLEVALGGFGRFGWFMPKHGGMPAGMTRLEVSQYVSRTVVIDDGQDEAAPKQERK